MSIKELDGLLSLLAEKKRKMEQEQAETNMQILLDFLHSLRKQKLEELNEVFALDFIYLCLSFILFPIFMSMFSSGSIWLWNHKRYVELPLADCT